MNMLEAQNTLVSILNPTVLQPMTHTDQQTLGFIFGLLSSWLDLVERCHVAHVS